MLESIRGVFRDGLCLLFSLKGGKVFYVLYYLDINFVFYYLKVIWKMFKKTVVKLLCCNIYNLYFCFQVPEKTAEVLIEEGFDCQYKGITQVKGKQPMTTYFVLYKSEPLWSSRSKVQEFLRIELWYRYDKVRGHDLCQVKGDNYVRG